MKHILLSSLLTLAGAFLISHEAHAEALSPAISPSAVVYQIDENTYAIQDESGEVSFTSEIGFKFPRIPGFPGRGDRGDRGDRGGGRYNPPSCESCNAFGCYTSGGGCNAFGCYVYRGGCNAFGCWYPGGMCNAFGCANEAGKSAGKCN